MSKRKLRLIITLAISVLILGYWGFYQPVPPAIVKSALEAEKEIDGFIINSISVEYDEKGQPTRRLVSKRTTHYPALDKTTLDQPDMLIYRQNKVPIKLVAQQGEIGPDNQQIELYKDVIVTEQIQDGFRMETDYLRIEPDNDYAETDTPVTLIHKTGKMQSIGMQAYFAEDRLKLLNNVRGIHEPR
ncbi:MAG: LPS export ABC transporter periplasmic protein LptC [Motiliproteus sp.]